MDKKQFIKELRKKQICYVWVTLFAGDGEYVQANKAHLIEIATKSHPENKFMAKIRDGALYIDSYAMDEKTESPD
jgi:hypothetical protein